MSRSGATASRHFGSIEGPKIHAILGCSNEKDPSDHVAEMGSIVNRESAVLNHLMIHDRSSARIK